MALDNIFSLFGFPDKDDEDRKKLEADLDVFRKHLILNWVCFIS